VARQAAAATTARARPARRPAARVSAKIKAAAASYERALEGWRAAVQLNREIDYDGIPYEVAKPFEAKAKMDVACHALGLAMHHLLGLIHENYPPPFPWSVRSVAIGQTIYSCVPMGGDHWNDADVEPDGYILTVMDAGDIATI
jgi:hypothetical protein